MDLNKLCVADGGKGGEFHSRTMDHAKYISKTFDNFLNTSMNMQANIEDLNLMLKESEERMEKKIELLETKLQSDTKMASYQEALASRFEESIQNLQKRVDDLEKLYAEEQAKQVNDIETAAELFATPPPTCDAGMCEDH